jgi:hypothetical protein
VVADIMKNKSILVLHNGNETAKPLIAETFNLKIEPTIAVFETLSDKINFLKTNTGCVTDLTFADYISVTDLYALKEFCTVVKVITTFENDLDHLESFLKDYDCNTWVTACSSNLWAADLILFANNADKFCVPATEIPFTFTPGRCGTNVLASITNTMYMHHEDVVISNLVQKLMFKEKIYSVLPDSFYKYACSAAIADQNELLVTTSKNIQQNTEKAKAFKSVELNHDELKSKLTDIAGFANILLLLKIIYQKNVVFTKFDYLKKYFASSNTLKNPYVTENLIIDYKKWQTVTDDVYQPIYNNIVDQIITHCGLTIL